VFPRYVRKKNKVFPLINVSKLPYLVHDWSWYSQCYDRPVSDPPMMFLTLCLLMQLTKRLFPLANNFSASVTQDATKIFGHWCNAQYWKAQ
jgi:hypothetical protein